MSRVVTPQNEQRKRAAGLHLADRRMYEVAKRILDVTVSGAVLVLLSPAWLLIALVIRLTSPGGSLFAGQVVGRNGRVFTYYKFRTMYANADDSKHRAWLAEFVRQDRPYASVGGPDGRRDVYKLIDDPRVTPVGRWLRRLSLDEIPQLINVLRGEMSLVGPRPPVVYEYEHYDDWARQRLLVQPGITGLYQVTNRSAVGFREMVRIDLEYIERRSLWLDLWIIWRTPIVMLKGEGAG